MTRYPLADAKARLPEIVAAARRGETVTITVDGEPVADVKPHAAGEPVKRKGGLDLDAGERWLAERGIDRLVTWVSPDFDDELPEDFLLRPLP